ncbi:PepSY domain-containing protein [Flavobacterium frigoris]|uniref:NADPH--hemoprotein reductase n=1 Tax=Flavobacterium frigoris TaxID=229204 RepID=A0A1H9PI58_FLAFI|nr:PepSY domain-containing protein [Flavobacterium frigoris]SER47827.1 sulfite reductase (NADPH) flavoprotein alpha-component [Flavobacterium frigoris]
MILSIWRHAHLVLALLASLVLIIASLTGIVLAIDVASEKTNPYQIDNFNEVTLVQFLPELRKVYPEISNISVDHNQFVTLEGFDQEGNEIKAYIDPTTGKKLGIPKQKNQFIQWNLALHRSLFLHETGRFIVGFASFLFFLIAISGTILLIKRQNGIKKFFSKVNNDSLAQYFHVVTGRIMLLPVLIIALTGTYLFLLRFEIIPVQKANAITYSQDAKLKEVPLTDFSVFKQTKLSEVIKIEFPFMDDDPEEFYVLKLKDSEITVNQITGQIVKEIKYPFTQVLEKFSFDLHTGQINWVWAIILAFASINILLFIYSGFTITLKRTKTRIKNKYKANECEFILLVGSENGSTLGFASKIHKQLQANGKKSYLTDMNNYSHFASAKQLIIFTSTYGLGEAPINAKKFKKLVFEFPQKQKIQFSVVGFGSKSYPDFCAYAKQVDVLLFEQSWAEKSVNLHTVNDKSADEFAEWVSVWATLNSLALATAASLYSQKAPKLKVLKVVDRAEINSDEVITFKLNLKSNSFTKFKSGDLLAIYPKNDAVERFYSIGKVANSVQLIVRLHPNGLGSEFLYTLQKGATIKARIIKNAHFYFPKNASQVALISNGTGIAPFLGMLAENKSRIETHLYCGFRRNDVLTKKYAEIAQNHIVDKKLSTFNLALSREEAPQYLMDLINEDQNFFLELLKNNGVIMICGALKMQKDVEAVLATICKNNGENFDIYKENNQILTDCY